MTVAIPEHTVDVWVGILVARVFPTALIWAPTQTSSPDFDLATDTRAGKLFILENKAPTVSRRDVDYEIKINQRQLYNYLVHDELRERTFYVLPCPRIAPSDIPGSTAVTTPAPHPTLIPAAANLRVRSGQDFRTIKALDLWTSLWPELAVPTSANPWWGSSRPSHLPADGTRSRCVDPCSLTALPGSQTDALGPTTGLRTFLRQVKACDLFAELYWPGDSSLEADKRPLRRHRQPREPKTHGPFTGTTLAVLVEQRSGIFKKWPSSA